MFDVLRQLFWPTKPKTPSTTTPTKPRGYALCVGLNGVDPDHYAGWSGPLNACENDARNMAAMLAQRGFTTITLLTRNATTHNFFNALSSLALEAKAGDIVCITNSSHGGQIPDYDADESDGQDETVCMYDREVLDDELAAAWASFQPGVRVLWVSDSCHSGTMVRAIGQHAVVVQDGSKALPPEVAMVTANINERTYRAVSAAVANRAPIAAYVLAFGACADNQTAMDGPQNGAFTGALLRTLHDYPGESLGRVLTRVQRALPPSQTPKYTYYGPRLGSWEKAAAFSI